MPEWWDKCDCKHNKKMDCNGRDELEIAEKARFDGEYVRILNEGGWKAFKMDVRCFLGTAISAFRGDGVVEGGTGEMKKRENEKK